MPKDTFHNLSSDKKRRIFDAAVKEFSTRRFSEASINQIVKAAEISRGSIYQYFSDKEDIYLYMCAEIAKEKQAIASRLEPLHPDAGVFEELIYKTKLSLELGRQRPEYKQIAMLMEKDDSSFIEKLRALSSADIERVRGLFERDKQRGLIKQNVDSGLVIEMVHTLAMKEYFQAGVDSDLFSGRMLEIIRIIREGIACNKKQEENPFPPGVGHKDVEDSI